ncbi:hypothetical protein M0R45_019421 [Rubus argutus]|uniref:Uncharacterized protein n=1 Tax=Rubus argutus TaxID=59490 RepID=A0AAW1X846_RUBAR
MSPFASNILTTVKNPHLPHNHHRPAKQTHQPVLVPNAAAAIQSGNPIGHHAVDPDRIEPRNPDAVDPTDPSYYRSQPLPSQNPEAIAASIPSNSAPTHLQCCASSRPLETRVSLLSPIVVADAAEPSQVKTAQTCEAHCCNNPAYPHQAVHLLAANRFDANSPVADALPSPCSHLLTLCQQKNEREIENWK